MSSAVHQASRTIADLPDLLADLPSRRIAVFGDYCVDAYWHLDDDHEVSVETGLPVNHVAHQRYGLGGAGNVVTNLRALGVGSVRAIGVHGGDPFGEVLRRLLRDLEVDIDGMFDLGAGRETAVYAKPHQGEEELERFDFGSRTAFPPDVIARIVEALTAAMAWADVVIVNQQVVGSLTDPALIAAVREVITADERALVLLDARDVAAEYRGAMLKLNEQEALSYASARGLTVTPDRKGDVPSLAQGIAAITQQPVFITRGERGIVAADANAIHDCLGVQVTEEIDPVGAGDTVIATIAAVQAAGGDVATAATCANLAASVTVRKLRTTGTVSPEELLAAAARPDHVYQPELADNPGLARVQPGTGFELVEVAGDRQPPTHVIFDHDGTLSTLREGWERVMEPVMLRAITGGRSAELDGPTLGRIQREVRDFIDRTTGIQTLVQMQGLVELVRRFGLVPEEEILDEHGYKAVYNDELIAMVHARLERLDAGLLAPEDFHIKNALPLLRALHAAGVTMHLASGTDQDDVIAEASALGFGPYFEDRIRGAVGDVKVEAKREVLDHIIGTHDLDPAALVTFGDGPVEMRETRRRGAYAIGVCSDETRRFGFNPDKRSRLIRGGANVLIPDYSDLGAVLALIGLPGAADVTTDGDVA